MIKIFDKSETHFNTLGYGFLDDAISCTVQKELNGEYALELTYPITGKLYQYLQTDNILFCETDLYKSPQPFRIYEINKSTEVVHTFKAQHISYDLCGITTHGFAAESLKSAVSALSQAITTPAHHNFTFRIDDPLFDVQDTIEKYEETSLKNILAALQSIYDVEIMYDGYDVIISKRLGADRGLEITYGKNLSELDYTINNLNDYTGIKPYFLNTSETATNTSNFVVREAKVNGDTTYCKDRWLKPVDEEEDNTIAWVKGCPMYRIKDSAATHQGIKLDGYIYNAASSDPSKWWEIKTYGKELRQAEIDAKQAANEIRSVSKLNTSVDPFTYGWMMDENDHIIDPFSTVITTTDDKGKTKTSYQVLYLNGDNIDPNYFGQFYQVVTEKVTKYTIEAHDPDAWELAAVGVYIKYDENSETGWDGQTVYWDEACTQKINEDDGSIEDTFDRNYHVNFEEDEFLPFAILGPANFKVQGETGTTTKANVFYRQMYSWNSTEKKFQTSGGKWYQKIVGFVSNLFTKITGKSTKKDPYFVDLTSKTGGECVNGVFYLNGHTESEIYQKIAPYDMKDYVTDSKPTVDKLYEEYDKNRKKIEKEFNKPDITINSSFIMLDRKTIDNITIEQERIELGDLVNVRYTAIDINLKQRISSMTYNVLKKRYDEISISLQKEEEEDE